MKSLISYFLSLCLFSISVSSFGVSLESSTLQPTTSPAQAKKIFDQWIGTIEMSSPTLEEADSLVRNLDKNTTDAILFHFSQTREETNFASIKKSVQSFAQEQRLEKGETLTKDQLIVLKNIVKQEVENQGANYFYAWEIAVYFVVLPILLIYAISNIDWSYDPDRRRNDSYRDREDDEDEEESGVEI